jgi:hypothetical protein
VKLKPLLYSTLLCLSMVITGARISSAQQSQRREPEWLTHMYEEGWQKVQKGVLQRATGGGQPETLGYGAEGLQWIRQGYERQVDALEDRYRQSRSKKLAEQIKQVKGEIARLNRALEEAPTVDGFDNSAMATCAISFGGTVQASPLDETLGVQAAASTYFHSDCGQLADTSATAYGHAINGTAETTISQSDPKNGGSWLDSQASASVPGATGCESWAQGSVTSGELGLSYQTPRAQNFSCAYNTSIYTLNSRWSWSQSGPGNLGPLTLYVGTGSSYTLIDSNYAPIATSGLPQAGISLPGDATGNLKFQGQAAIDTTAAFASASIVKIELAGRLTAAPNDGAVLAGVGHFVSGVGHYGIRMWTDEVQRLGVSSFLGASPGKDHVAPGTLPLNDTTVEAYRWVWTEKSVGSSTGTSQWWRKIAGIWQPWGASKTDMPRPVGHANTRMRLHAWETGADSFVGFDYLQASVTIGTR